MSCDIVLNVLTSGKRVNDGWTEEEGRMKLLRLDGEAGSRGMGMARQSEMLSRVGLRGRRVRRKHGTGPTR